MITSMKNRTTTHPSHEIGTYPHPRSLEKSPFLRRNQYLFPMNYLWYVQLKRESVKVIGWFFHSSRLTGAGMNVVSLVKPHVEIIPEGLLYLADEKNERKSTGSYFTPDYIVRFITEETIGPTLTKLRTEFEELIEELESDCDLPRRK